MSTGYALRERCASSTLCQIRDPDWEDLLVVNDDRRVELHRQLLRRARVEIESVEPVAGARCALLSKPFHWPNVVAPKAARVSAAEALGSP